MKLNCTKKVVFSCDYSDIEELITKVYGHDYEIMPMEEVGSSQYSATYDVNISKSVMDEYELDGLQTLIDGKPKQFILNDILTDLCNRDYIEAGEYIIDISW